MSRCCPVFKPAPPLRRRHSIVSILELKIIIKMFHRSNFATNTIAIILMNTQTQTLFPTNASIAPTKNPMPHAQRPLIHKHPVQIELSSIS